jgi:hypothetical protein
MTTLDTVVFRVLFSQPAFQLSQTTEQQTLNARRLDTQGVLAV